MQCIFPIDDIAFAIATFAWFKTIWISQIESQIWAQFDTFHSPSLILSVHFVNIDHENAKLRKTKLHSLGRGYDGFCDSLGGEGMIPGGITTDSSLSVDTLLLGLSLSLALLVLDHLGGKQQTVGCALASEMSLEMS